MEIATTRHDDSAVVRLCGRFDAFEVDGFREAVEELQSANVNTISVDLHEVTFIDSTGLAELVRGMKRCRSAGGDLILATPSDAVRVILELTRLDTAFDIAA